MIKYQKKATEVSEDENRFSRIKKVAAKARSDREKDGPPPTSMVASKEGARK